MGAALAIAVCAAFVLIAAWHFRMAAGQVQGESAAVPSVDGKPLFQPSRTSTVAVGVVLVGFAALVAGKAGFIDTSLPHNVLGWVCYALAAGLLARAIGDFRYVGFFKKVRGSSFARMDTRLYSPLCLLLAVGVAAVGAQ